MIDSKTTKKWLRYPVATLIGIVTIVCFVFIGIQVVSLIGPPSETGYLGMLFGLILGIPIGSFISGRIVRSIIGLSHHWLKIAFMSPGIWIALFIIIFQIIEYNISSEYVLELIIPCVIAVVLSLYMTHRGAKLIISHNDILNKG